MDLPGLDRRPGKVVQAEIWRRFASPVSFDPRSSRRQFFLVLSFGRCVFRLSEHVAALILESVIGGCADSFRAFRLDDRVFRFSVHSQDVGFHIYKLRSFESPLFKVFFNLWNNGGPNFRHELRNWELEQAAEWTEVARKKSNLLCSPALVRVTGANSIPVRNPRSHGTDRHGHDSQAPKHGRQSVFQRLNVFDGHNWIGFNRHYEKRSHPKRYIFKGIPGPAPLAFLSGPGNSRNGPLDASSSLRPLPDHVRKADLGKPSFPP